MTGFTMFEREVTSRVTDCLLMLENKENNVIKEIKSKIKSANDDTRIFLYWTYAGLTLIFDELSSKGVVEKKQVKNEVRSEKSERRSSVRKNGVQGEEDALLKGKGKSERLAKDEVRVLSVNKSPLSQVFSSVMSKINEAKKENVYVLSWEEGANEVFEVLKSCFHDFIKDLDLQLNLFRNYRELRSQMAGSILRLQRFIISAKYYHARVNEGKISAYDVYWLRSQERDTYITNLVKPIDETLNNKSFDYSVIADDGDIFTVEEDKLTTEVCVQQGMELDGSCCTEILEPLSKHRMRIDNRFGTFISVPRNLRDRNSTAQEGGKNGGKIITSRNGKSKEFERGTIMNILG